MPERHLVTIPENVDIERRLAINAQRMDLWARSSGWRIQQIEQLTFSSSEVGSTPNVHPL